MRTETERYAEKTDGAIFHSWFLFHSRPFSCNGFAGNGCFYM